MGKSSINRPFSMAMLNNQRVNKMGKVDDQVVRDSRKNTGFLKKESCDTIHHTRATARSPARSPDPEMMTVMAMMPFHFIEYDQHEALEGSRTRLHVSPWQVRAVASLSQRRSIVVLPLWRQLLQPSQRARLDAGYRGSGNGIDWGVFILIKKHSCHQALLAAEDAPNSQDRPCGHPQKRHHVLYVYSCILYTYYIILYYIILYYGMLYYRMG